MYEGQGAHGHEENKRPGHIILNKKDESFQEKIPSS